MFDVLGSLKSSVLKIKTFDVDNSVFRLHYRFTVLILLAFSILVTCRQYIGDPIDCTAPSATIRAEVIDQYCWVSSTNSLTKAFNKPVGKEVIYPGVDKYVKGDERVYHQYYQWVCFVLFLQAVMFYLPHYLWKTWECGRLKALTADLDGPVVGDDVKKQRILALQAYFSNSLYHHEFYGWRHFVCEMLNFVNVVGQMFLTDRFLGGTFLTYGTEVINFTEADYQTRTDPMVRVFPRVTKCAFYTTGSTGDSQLIDSICVIPINIINEKIYIVLWFWFVFLAVLSGLALVYRLVTAFVPRVRLYLLRARASSVSAEHLAMITSDVKFGDWFILYLLSKNINSYIFKEVVDVVLRVIKNKDAHPEKNELLLNEMLPV